MNSLSPNTIAVVDDEALTRKRLGEMLRRRGYEVHTFPDGTSFMSALEGVCPGVVLLDVRLPDISGMELLPRIKERCPHTEVIIITGYASVDDAVEAVKEGAFYYLAKPVNPKQLEVLLKRAVEKVALVVENLRLRREGEGHFEGIVGISTAMRQVLEAALKVAPTDCNVLITGESGTGKELLARAIHNASTRAGGPFVSFNCGGFTEELIANELFGHEREAFTGAHTTKIGLLEAAQGGTIFLDEVSEMPPSMQVKLLRVIQERKLLRVGGTKPIDLDIRVIAATNKDLQQEVSAGRFRQDLYYRLNVVHLRVPPLREHREDIPILINHFLEKYNKAYRKDIQGFSKEALELLMNYPFPGNIRELENIVSGAVALAETQLIRPRDLPGDLAQFDVQTLDASEFVSLEENERLYILRVLEATGGNRAKAARILKIPRSTLWRKLKRYGLEGP